MKKKKLISKLQQTSKNNVGDTVQTGDNSPVIIDKSKHKHIHVSKYSKEKSKRKKEISNKYETNENISNDLVKINKGKIRKKEKSKIIENKCFLFENQYFLISLGILNVGDIIKGSCRDTLGKNFSYRIINNTNRLSYQTYSKVYDSIRKGSLRNEFKFNCKIKYRDSYFLLFTHRTYTSDIVYRIKIIEK